MIITIVPADRTIICDGEVVQLKPWPFEDTNIHAIQWQDTEGEIEYHGFPRPDNESFDDISIIQHYIDAFNEALIPPEEPS